MKILLEQSGYGLDNLGDIAMLQVAVQRLQANMPGAELSVFTSSPERLSRFCPGTTPANIEGRTLCTRPGCLFGPLGRKVPSLERGTLLSFTNLATNIVHTRTKLRRRSSSSLDDYIEAIRSSDLVISSGGGFLTDAFPWQVDGVHCTFMLAKKFGKPFALMGQGIGPLDGHRLRTLTREFLTDAGLIGLREGVGGTSILKELGITGDKVIVTGDDAVQLGYSRHKPVVGDGLGINIRLASYSRVKPEDVNRLRTILRDIVKELGTSFVPLPVALDFEGGDPTSISRLISTEDEQSDGGLALTEPLDLVERVSRCRTVITGSYHAAVFALSQGIPIIGLVMSPYYQYKFAGLSQLFPGGCTVVTLDDPDLAGALLRAVETNWATAAERRAALLGHAERQVNLGNAAYERLYALAG